MSILVIDIGGSHVKCAVSQHPRRVRFRSGPKLTAAAMVEGVLRLTKGWRYRQVSIGYPGVVRDGKPLQDPHNLGPGWVGFDFEASFGRPVKVINDAAMQALGDYRGGKMLFLGLGTGLGSALIVDDLIVPMELAHLPYAKHHDYEHFLGEAGRRRSGDKKWRDSVLSVVEDFRKAFRPDYVVLGGGNAVRVKRLPPRTRRGKNSNAFLGGFRLWTTTCRGEP
jgi:predicted NBD/HSP70 family sugar kinase